MTTTPDMPRISFAYTAQTYEGQRMSGTIDATDVNDASQRLASMRLRLIQLDPAQRPTRARPLTGEDFAAFNQQLANLSAAGLPIEQGLRLIAEDLRHGGLAQSVRDVSAELERGASLGEAFQKHQKQFPPLYGTIIEAGVRANNLPGVLLNLGRHLELVARLRASIWSAAAYPLTVMAGLLIVLIFIGHFILPQFQEMYDKWYTPLPTITRLVFGVAKITPYLIGLAVVLFVGMPLVWVVLRGMRLDRAAADLALPLPMIGGILKRNLIARWCGAMKLGIQGAMDLPGAVKLASDVVASPALRRDGARILFQLEAGRHLDEPDMRTLILPKTLLAIIQLAADRNDLPTSLDTLATMYQQQADMRLATLQATLTPALIIGVAVLVGTCILGLFAPMLSLFQLFG